MYLSSILFAVVFFVAIGVFTRNIRRIIRNINLGRKTDRSDQKSKRWKHMTTISFRSIQDGSTTDSGTFAYHCLRRICCN